MRKVRKIKCQYCHNIFETTSTNALFCPTKPECQKAKQLRWGTEKRQHRKAVPEAKPGQRRCIFIIIRGNGKARPCGKSTGRNYFFCRIHHGQVDDVSGAYGDVTL